MEQKSPKADEQVLREAVHVAIETGEYIILPHARQRCRERDVSAMDIEFVLAHGHRAKARDRFAPSLRRWSYGFEGRTIDGNQLRVIVAILERLGIVTVVIIGGEND